MKIMFEITKRISDFKVSVNTDSGDEPREYNMYPTTLARMVTCVIKTVTKLFRGST